MTNESESGESDSDRIGNELPTAAFHSKDVPTDADIGPTIGADFSGQISGGMAQPAQDSTALPSLDGYELLEELGRGGMGVVYRARHTKLDRPVAVKMILAGQFASPESIARFTLEAETAARLDHPGIVPIYEIGQAGEHHFFSMKLINGQPLSELLGEYQPDQRRSAQLMIEIARAVQHAHQRGVLHRDLKPANVLIDEAGHPLLTDLGLAKQLDSDTAITQTGLVLGSPGFMSPEQAAGQTDVTTAADVYAMGAMLYWLVSGQPPITGQSAFDVVRKTIEHEPESIRQLRGDADRDLNLICLKALQKDPEKRYQSAEQFAGELQAWLDGEPLSVKPPTLFTSMRRWIQKNFRGVTVGVGVGVVCGLLLGFVILLQIAQGQLQAANSLHDRLQAADPPLLTTYFAWVELVPQGLRESLTGLVTVITAVCGLATIGLSKPKRGDSGVAAALTAALLSGILAFIISWAWQPIANRSHQASLQDLQLLADHVFLHPDDRELAEETLMRRYPGLSDVAPWTRSDLLTAKIFSDQASSIPVGIWTGLIVTVLVAALPLFVSSLLASVIWLHGHRGWAFFWRSLEIGYYATTLLFILSRSLSDFTGPPPALRFQVISAMVVMLSVAIALQRKSVWWRVPMLLLVFISTGVNLADSAKVSRAHWRAREARTVGEFAEIAPFLERQIASEDDRYRRFQLATVYAYLGDKTNYKKHCDFLLADGNFYDRTVAEQAAKLVFLKPNWHDDLSQAYQLAVWASTQRGFNAWDYLCRTLAEYRQGNFDVTHQWAIKCRETAREQGSWQKGELIATSHLIDALAYQSQGEVESSKESLAEAEKIFDFNSDSSFEPKLTYILLRAEWLQASSPKG